MVFEPLLKWDPAEINYESDFTMFIVGSKYQGKSNFIRDMWINRWRKHFDFIILFCDNPQNKAYDFLTDSERRFVFPGYNEDIIRDFDMLQYQTSNFFHILTVWDDCSSINVKLNDMVQQCFIRGRNIRMSTAFSTQYFLNISPGCRANIDFLVAFQLNGAATKRNFIEMFLLDEIELGPDITFAPKSTQTRALLNMYTENTGNYFCIILSLRQRLPYLMRFKASAPPATKEERHK